MPSGVAVVVPVWRDADRLPAVLGRLVRMRGLAEAVVACTRPEFEEVAERVRDYPPVRVTSSRRGRAAQMNAGARCTSSEWLLFLHADSIPHAGALEEILAVRDPREAGGCFRLSLDARGWRPRLIELAVRARVRLLNLPYGDQGLFVRRTVFEALGGFSDLPLMEDVDFVRRLGRAGRVRRSRLEVVTSARRWERDGWMRRTLSNWWLAAQYVAGVPPRRLARRYTGRADGVVAVFGRAPGAGGKTRLWRSLEIPPDLPLMAALLEDTMQAAAGTAGTDRALILAPEAGGRCPAAPQGWDLLLQEGKTLGERMFNAFDELLGMGYEHVVLIGSDLPTLPPRILQLASDLLRRRQADVVLGPSEDGGYYLIGARDRYPELFDAMPWSTADVLAETERRARARGLALARLEPWYDVDDRESLLRAAAEAGHSAPRTKARLRELLLGP